MDILRFWIHFVGLFISILTCIKGDLPKPTFPDTFEVEVQGLFLDRLTEVDGALYYDKLNNRAALTYTYQGETTTRILKFDDNEMFYIDGSQCTVSEISDKDRNTFFPFSIDKDKKKILATPEELFFFTKSVLDMQELSTIPTYIYQATWDFPLYERFNCTVLHIFSKPEVEVPDCEGHACRSTLMSISIKCLNDNMETAMNHIYNFFRFRSGIRDKKVFQAPVGVHCNAVNKLRFPALPAYFSFSYHILEDMGGSASAIGVNSIQKRIWYDSKLRLLRVDEFDLNGLVDSSRIFDIYGGAVYTTVANTSSCVSGPISEDVAVHKMTRLPNILFSKKPSLQDAVYVGERDIAGMLYYVWSLSFTDAETAARNVQEFYFTKVKTDNEGGSQLKLAHLNSYIYEGNKDNQVIKRSVATHVSISNFRSKPKEWEAFDIAPCFAGDQRKGFRLKVTGPAVIKDTYMYEDLLERLYMRLIIVSNVSVVRISELKGMFDGVQITEFSGWILDKPSTSGSETGQAEPDTNTAYKMIEKAASDGLLTIKIKKSDEEIKYLVTAIEEVQDPKRAQRDCFSGGTMAATSLVLFFVGMCLSLVAYYVFLRRKKPRSDDKVQMSSTLNE